MRRAASIATAALVLAGSGCVQQDKYDNTVISARSLKEQLVVAERERDTANANLDEVRGQLAGARQTNDTLQGEVTQLNTDFETQAEQYDELLRRVSQLEFGPLPFELEQALDHLAESYPDVLSFDAAHGVLQFSSDFTFDLGSVELKPEAAATITTLADILNTLDAAPFELRLIGHTDNVPVEKPSTRRRHPTNVHLSVHRAISVRDVLVQAGVQPTRIQVAGYGEFRPIVPNGRKGAADNRRVELTLVPMRAALAAPTTPTPLDEVDVVVEEMPMK
jgi:chemotaxis protein MotB